MKETYIQRIRALPYHEQPLRYYRMLKGEIDYLKEPQLKKELVDLLEDAYDSHLGIAGDLMFKILYGDDEK